MIIQFTNSLLQDIISLQKLNKGMGDHPHRLSILANFLVVTIAMKTFWERDTTALSAMTMTCVESVLTSNMIT